MKAANAKFSPSATRQVIPNKGGPLGKVSKFKSHNEDGAALNQPNNYDLIVNTKNTTRQDSSYHGNSTDKLE